MPKRKDPERPAEAGDQDEEQQGSSKKRKQTKKPISKEAKKPDQVVEATDIVRVEKERADNEDDQTRPDVEDDEQAQADAAEMERRRQDEDNQREKMKSILATFTPSQMDRYECYRRSALQRGSVKKLMHSIASTTINLPMAIIMAGVAKLYVGELVETGLIVKEERNEAGPLRPEHIREAYRRVQSQGKLPSRTKSKPKLFR
ncbi:transcription initiation factor TFIID subunit 11 [Cymbomonas tetramitiformis]|uniref:Transcription initiation factor TFIID subunit 11 n=1 Tax=Cymbomonas tetramitiformis TaxID=36881 RepID=A0AAE0L1M0_9CHLO|nr:transcription initiation factor TFIID subunit 11 [Cymbomonas tetramitiformis]